MPFRANIGVKLIIEFSTRAPTNALCPYPVKMIRKATISKDVREDVANILK